jgi:hypothetical protein
MRRTGGGYEEDGRRMQEDRKRVGARKWNDSGRKMVMSFCTLHVKS